MKDLVRRHTAAELILTDTTERAIDAIEQRVPDLVLIPALMSPEDDEALSAALRVTEDAKHVQTLTIPLLGAPQSRSLPQGVLSRLRGQQARPAAPDGCDPKLFAEQITEYLQRVAKDRSHLPSGNGNGKSAGQGTHGTKEAATPTSAHGNTQSGSHTSGHAGGQSHGSRKVKAAAAHPPAQKAPAPAEKSQPTAEPPRLVAPAPTPSPVQAAPPPPVHTPPPPEPVASEPDVSALEAALSQVSFDQPEAVSSSAPAPVETAEAKAEAEALEKGLSSLLDRLSDVDWSDESATTQPVKAVSPPPPPPTVAPPVAPPLAAPKVSAPSTPPDPAQWAELKQLESIEYAMPKIIPQDAPPPAAEAHQAEPPAPQATAPRPPSPPPPAVAPQPAAKPAASEWGDLLDSLKKDLGK